MFLWFVFCVFGKDVSVLKMFVFPVWGALGGHILVYLGLEGLGVLCSLFLFFVCLGLFSFKLFCFALLVDCVWCCFVCWRFLHLFFFVVCFVLFVLECFCYFWFFSCCFFRHVFVLFFVFLGVV